jgi:hypothetical protein
MTSHIVGPSAINNPKKTLFESDIQMPDALCPIPLLAVTASVKTDIRGARDD